MYSIRYCYRDVVLCCAVQRLACYERSDFLKVTRELSTATDVLIAATKEIALSDGITAAAGTILSH